MGVKIDSRKVRAGEKWIFRKTTNMTAGARPLRWVGSYTPRLKRTTPSYMVYGETGCTPLHVDIMKRALCFYVKLQQPNNGTLASVMLSALHKKHHRGDIESKYLIYIR